MYHATEKLLETFWIEGFIGLEHKGTDLVTVSGLGRVVVMGWVSTGRCVMAVRVIMFVIMVMMVMSRIRAGRMVVIVIMIVRSIRVIIRKKLRINIQNRIQIKAADIDQLLEIGFTKMNGFD